MKLPEIDWDRIDSILARAEEAVQSGKMDRETWLALAGEFSDVSHGSLGMPGILGRSGETEWFEELHKEPSQRVA
jgi:hypothetical protein